MDDVEDMKQAAGDFSDQKDSNSSADESDSSTAVKTIPFSPLSIKPGRKSLDMPPTPTTPHTPGTAPPGRFNLSHPPGTGPPQTPNNHKVPSPGGSTGSTGSAETPQYLSPGHGSPDPVHDLHPELLQAGWRHFWSRREGRPYFFNKITNESLWEMPPMPGQGDLLSDPLGIGGVPVPAPRPQRSLSRDTPGSKRRMSEDTGMMSPNKKLAFTRRLGKLLVGFLSAF
jgi:hypothetical protein